MLVCDTVLSVRFRDSYLGSWFYAVSGIIVGQHYFVTQGQGLKCNLLGLFQEDLSIVSEIHCIFTN